MVLELPRELEQRLQQEANRKGLAKEALVQTLIERHLRRVAPPITLTFEEQKSLDSLNAELSREFWHRYTILRDTPSRNGDEQVEFIRMVAVTEEWNVRRLTLLEEMARQRGMHFPELMRALNIKNHPDAGST